MGRRSRRFLILHYFFSRVNQTLLIGFGAWVQFLPSSLLNARLHFHVTVILISLFNTRFRSQNSFHFIFSFLKNKKNKKLCNKDYVTCLFCLTDIRLKMWTGKKLPSEWVLEEKMFPFF